MVATRELEKLNLAFDLLNAGLRISFVNEETLIDKRTLRLWWKEKHGRPLSKGRRLNSIQGFIKSYEIAANLSAFISLHKHLYGSDFSIKMLYRIWKEYQLTCGDLDINIAYLSLRDIRRGTVCLSYCNCCKIDFVYDAANRYTSRCPFCKNPVIKN
ncbi:MAG: hypothetical protein KF908_10380 [Nitrosomonas sp.]|uniref:Transcriptional activator (FlhC) n=1 Tax=Nitrosomonas aestuarii TaxID=52441 RepID=A0A1I4CVR0_9PROT|nr:FlhC family transcriptional regulator [Nitrosomonas aestuarii]MBX3630290.1 hypothetical protein [Nitrosomonas sp.]SFK85332.1 transcriptional activator (FlhC) [Nitrosomonas aestuarii]